MYANPNIIFKPRPGEGGAPVMGRTTGKAYPEAKSAMSNKRRKTDELEG